MSNKYVTVERTAGGFKHHHERTGETKEIQTINLFQSVANMQETLSSVSAGLNFMETILAKVSDHYVELGDYDVKGLAVIIRGLFSVCDMTIHDNLVESEIIEKLVEGEI